ncbi:MAG: hypothetical protein M1540_08855 [Candidatus Bathyarchaeota archaeon]|nr:hypothetical protein [Candidatus Bathyarchaeota archaeon]
MVSGKAKTDILGIVGVAGLLISMFMAVVLFGPYFGFSLLTVDENLAIVVFSISIAVTVMGFSFLQKTAIKITKEAIADFANPILNSKGKVSAREIADKPLKGKMEIAILVKSYLEPMIGEGYFEGARLEGGWLVKDVIPCEYCGKPVRLTDTKCSSCGATIKK